MWKSNSVTIIFFTIGVCSELFILCAIGKSIGIENQEYDSMHPQLQFLQQPLHFHHYINNNNNDDVVRGNIGSNRRVKRAPLPLKFDANEMEKHADYWNNMAQNRLEMQLHKNHLNKNMAKNIILFIGDGMSIPTLAATRVYMGGENRELSFEKFPYSGLSKTYCANTQVADSACSATAYLGGVKANYATIGLTASVKLNDCGGENKTAYHVPSIAKWAQHHRMSTGFVTTTEVTNASPAGIYAHTANRNWENDQELIRNGGQTDLCTDIAKQLIFGDVGERLNVIMGGGRSQFIPNTEIDIDGVAGKRGDNENLIEHWKRKHHHHTSNYIQTKKELIEINSSTEFLFGLFDSGHLPFHLEEKAKEKPTLSEMVNKALDILETNENGYFLFVEGGRIDHGHHKTQAGKALDETVEFSKAIELARLRTDEKNTLIVVTSDHSHTMTMAGYSSRGNDILGINDSQDGLDKLPYSTLTYANGPGYNSHEKEMGGRENLRQLNMQEKSFEYPSASPLLDETHGGDDVGVFASGPWAHLFTGTYEQNYIPHALAYAACIGKGLTSCRFN